MFFKKYGDYVVSVFYAILGIAMILAAKALPKSKVMEIGPDFWPMVVGGLILILAVILFIGTFRNRNKVLSEAETREEADYKRVLGSLILALAYVNLLKPIGFIVCTLLYLLAQIFVLAPDSRRTKKDMLVYLVIDVIFTFVVYFLFRYGFTIVLPQGIFSL